jgi:hypothetical protein
VYIGGFFWVWSTLEKPEVIEQIEAIKRENLRKQEEKRLAKG